MGLLEQRWDGMIELELGLMYVRHMDLVHNCDWMMTMLRFYGTSARALQQLRTTLDMQRKCLLSVHTIFGENEVQRGSDRQAVGFTYVYLLLYPYLSHYYCISEVE